MLKLFSFGEMLIDFISEDGATFSKQAGGAPANVACGFARLGGEALFVGKVGADPFGRFLKLTLNKNNVNTEHFLLDKRASTTLAFVSLDEAGEREFFFVRNPGADTLLEEQEFDYTLLDNSCIFHYGSISLIEGPTRETLLNSLHYAQEQGVITSYDPNLRLTLWQSAEIAREEIIKGLSFATIVKLTDDELHFITGCQSVEAGARYVTEQGPQLIFITGGEKGAKCYYKGKLFEEKGYRVATVDTTGAGDGFTAAMLYFLARQGTNLEYCDKTIRDCLAYANRAGALVTTRYGAISSLPTNEEIEAFGRES